MSAPTLAYGGNSNITDTTTTETITSVTWAAGDIVLVIGITSDNTNTFTGTPAATGLTFAAITATTGTNPTNTGSTCKGYAWSATAGAGGTQNITISGTAGVAKYIAAWVITGSDGVGNAVFDTASANTVSLTRTQANSAVLWGGGDWNANSDVTVTASPAGGTQRAAATNASFYTCFNYDWPDEGATGTQSYGIGSYAGTLQTKVAIEVKGAAGGAAAVIPDIVMPPLTQN